MCALSGCQEWTRTVTGDYSDQRPHEAGAGWAGAGSSCPGLSHCIPPLQQIISSDIVTRFQQELTRHKLVSDAEFEEGLDIIDCLYTV